MKTEGTWMIDPDSLIEDEVWHECLERGESAEKWMTPEDVILQDARFPFVTPGCRLFSTSIFWPHAGRHKVRGTPINDFFWFRENILPHQLQAKFFDPLNRRWSEFGGEDVCHRLYLDYRLSGAAEWLMETYGFHQVFLMRTGDEPMREGMLWRYLPILDHCKEVFCTGVDSYREELYDGFIRHPSAGFFEAGVVSNRAICPFAGPMRSRPSDLRAHLDFLRESPMPGLIDGYLEMWEELPESFAAQYPKFTRLLHFNRTVNQRRLKICDAVFLTAMFLNRKFLSRASEGATFIETYRHKFASFSTCSDTVVNGLIT